MERLEKLEMLRKNLKSLNLNFFDEGIGNFECLRFHAAQNCIKLDCLVGFYPSEIESEIFNLYHAERGLQNEIKID